MAQRNARPVGGIYQVGQVITSGGMLTSYTAYNRNTNDVVGLLVVEFAPAIDAQTVQQLLQPLERRRSIDSPNLIHVYDWGIDGNRLYIATDPPRGMTLRYVLDNENIDLDRVLELTRQMARGLKLLHEQGVSGVDLRPQLITVDSLVEADRVQLDDVGLRSLLNVLGYVNSQREDDIGFLDPRYAPPEYINGGLAGPWSDVYQLGLLLFEMVAGRLPFVGRTPAETGVLQNTASVPRVAQYRQDTPAPLQDVVDCALAKNSALRFANAAAMLSILDAIQLPRRRSSGARHGNGGSPTSPGLGANELSAAEKDNSLDATIIADQPTIRPTARQPETTKIYAFLCYEQEGVEMQRFAITKKDVVVGRIDPKRGFSPDIDLSPIDQKMSVSRQHVRIRYEETFFYIEDLKSRNKTRLGELPLVPLKPELLRHGDLVHLGSVRLVFKVPGMPDKPVFTSA
ncbi:MAG: FHA domain-containing serine/threonine-protein kinase [Ktedonobacteraceae bacterium]